MEGQATQKMIGQLTDSEFLAICEKAGILRYKINNITKRAWVMYGKNTMNLYVQHPDGSWTNYGCKTIN